MKKFTRCEKNLVKKKTLEYMIDTIGFYINLKQRYDDAETDEERQSYEEQLVETDAKISSNAFRYGLAAISVLDGVDDAFRMVEDYHSNNKGDKSDDGKDSK